MNRTWIFREKGLRLLSYSLILCIAAVLAVVARADTIYLKNNKRFDGVIVKEGDRDIVFDVIMEGSRMRMSFSRDEIDRIERSSAGEREALEREAAREQEEREKLEQEMRNRGLVPFRGKWITEEARRQAREAEKREAGEEEAAEKSRAPSSMPRAPKFDLPDLGGNLHIMDEYRGNIILLFFWGTWSRPCAYQVQTLKRVYEKYRDEGVLVLGISLDTNPEKVRNFVRARKIEFPILCDLEGWKSPVVKKYGVKRLPATFLIDGAGDIRATGVLGEAIPKEIAKLLGK